MSQGCRKNGNDSWKLRQAKQHDCGHPEHEDARGKRTYEGLTVVLAGCIESDVLQGCDEMINLFCMKRLYWSMQYSEQGNLIK